MNPYLAVIDIGSNSARLVIYKQNTQNKFQLQFEQKYPVRIGEGAYLKSGYLQPIPQKRAYLALQEFTTIIKNYHVSETICIATSALRDAPNKNDFTDWIKRELNLKIKIIDGQEEAKLGAIAALKLLPIANGITIDIGGGSSDIALIKESKIVDSYSLNLGTVRIKELFSSQKSGFNSAKAFIVKELELLPTHFKSHHAIGIGGTTRTLSKTIMRLQKENSNTIHNFHYNREKYKGLFQEIIEADDFQLKALKISKNRIDTIREGTLIWQSILEKIEAKEIISSSVGVREGIFLKHRNLMGRDNQPIIFTTKRD